MLPSIIYNKPHISWGDSCRITTPQMLCVLKHLPLTLNQSDSGDDTPTIHRQLCIMVVSLNWYREHQELARMLAFSQIVAGLKMTMHPDGVEGVEKIPWDMSGSNHVG